MMILKTIKEHMTKEEDGKSFKSSIKLNKKEYKL